jgi:hypothetical protein
LRPAVPAWMFLLLALMVSPRPCAANRFISVDLGYFSTTSPEYTSGFVYGLGLTEGRGKIGFGITARRLANTYTGEETTILDGKVYKAEFEEDIVDFYVTIMGLYRLNDPKQKDHVMAGAGPQVHFINSSRTFSATKFSARDFRLGVGAIIRYQRRIDMFGRTALVVTAAYSHMQSVESRTDQYEPPTRSMNITTVTAGLAFPF